MNNIVDLEKLFHRSRSRIRVFGEVFTPENSVEDLLNLLSADCPTIWSDEGVIFFEPCAGHGNILVGIFRRRLEGIYKKALRHKIPQPELYAVANSINTLWAIDLDKENIRHSRLRIFHEIITFLSRSTVFNMMNLSSKQAAFVAHVLCAIRWHVSENESFSSLSAPADARENANKTKLGSKWFVKNGHSELNFDLSWCEHFKQLQDRKIDPLIFTQASQFIKSIRQTTFKFSEKFDFAVMALGKPSTQIFGEVK